MKNFVKQAFILLTILWMLTAGCQQSGGASNTDNTSSKENNKQDSKKNTHNAQSAPDRTTTPRISDDLDRDPSRLIYSKHARCRMACRHIDESEVQEILLQGRINERKSEPAGRPDPKYALEGTTRDGQEVRIVFAMARKGIVVVTVIDLDTDWTCHCK